MPAVAADAIVGCNYPTKKPTKKADAVANDKRSVSKTWTASETWVEQQGSVVVLGIVDNHRGRGGRGGAPIDKHSHLIVTMMKLLLMMTIMIDNNNNDRDDDDDDDSEYTDDN